MNITMLTAFRTIALPNREYAAYPYQSEIKVLKPFAPLNLSGTVFRTQSLIRFAPKQFLNKLLAVCRCSNVIWPFEMFVDDIVESFISETALKRSGSREHFVYQNTEGPPIDSRTLPDAIDDFWCNILFRANE